METQPMDEPCVFCTTEGGQRVYADPHCRVVLTSEPFTGFCRVVVARHVREMTDLPAAEREHVLRVVFALETTLREMLHPDKMNIASLGNVVPHVHWHVIPRFVDDSHFPKPVWADAVRAGAPHPLPGDFVPKLAARLVQVLQARAA
jgi:diadenosine tetraphosphate (Ap4A) HIT family hydrolase